MATGSGLPTAGKFIALITLFVILRPSLNVHRSFVSGESIWLEAHNDGETLRSDDAEINRKLNEVQQRVGPHMKASSDYRDFEDIHLEESLLSWRNFHHKSKIFADHQVNLYESKIRNLLNEAEVSRPCLESAQTTLNSIRKLDSWSIKLWNSMGNFPPTGLLDGQFTDLGSFRGCVDLKIPDDAGFGSSYCTVSFRPIIESRHRFHMIFEKENPKLLNLFNKSDVFNELAHTAQYFHYIYLRTGVCVPNSCSAKDIQKIAKFVARSLSLMSGPVKCYSRQVVSNLNQSIQHDNDDKVDPQSIASDGAPVQVQLGAPMNFKQIISLTVIALVYGAIILATLVQLISNFKRVTNSNTQSDYIKRRESEGCKFETTHFITQQLRKNEKKIEPEVGLARHLSIWSAVTNLREYLEPSKKTVNEIECLHGLRALTMIWIICVHTLQYNEWSGFTRVFENVSALQNIALHPIYNANYVVDNFFLMSGLLISYRAWYNNKGTGVNFSFTRSLLGRYLRLTPQVLLISLMYIILPLIGEGPFWYDMTHHEAKYCEKNWWVNLLHLQAFYRPDEMCNLVGWWISIDMFFYIFALGIIYMMLNGHKKKASFLLIAFTSALLSRSAYKHFRGGFPPNNLGVIPQVGEVWTWYVIDFFWSPLPHAFPFFFGLWLGYVLANSKWQQQVWAFKKLGWNLATISLITVNLSSHIWMSGAVKLGNQYISTTYNNICTIVWALAFGWVIIACHYGTATQLNKFLGSRPFVLLSKASFIIYLSHMLVIRLYFGVQKALLEVSTLTFIYIMIGNITVSIIFGVFLCITFEGPFMKIHKIVMQKLRSDSKSHHNGQRNEPNPLTRDEVVIKMDQTTTRSLIN